MSVRVEWMSVEWFSCEVVTRGEVIGGNVVTASHALVLAGDEVTVIEGPKETLLGVLRTLQSALDGTEPDAAVATYGEDNRCCSCGEHIADPHAPDCPNHEGDTEPGWWPPPQTTAQAGGERQ